MKKVTLNGKIYQLIENKSNCFNEEDVIPKFTEYFDTFDYVLGDYSYGKLRLKGFYDSTSNKKTKINDVSRCMILRVTKKPKSMTYLVGKNT